MQLPDQRLPTLFTAKPKGENANSTWDYNDTILAFSYSPPFRRMYPKNELDGKGKFKKELPGLHGVAGHVSLA